MIYFIVDIETTGLDCFRNEIITLSMSAFKDEERLEELELKFRPERLKYWSREAELVHGYSIQQTLFFNDKRDSYCQLIHFIEHHSDESATMVCHGFDKFKTLNLFDVNFIKVGLEEFGFYWAFRKYIKRFASTESIFREAAQNGKFNKMSSYALNDLCKHFNIPLIHHDAQSDRVGCEKLFFKAKELGFYEPTED